MEKRLIYEFKDGIEAVKSLAVQLELNCNRAVDVFNSHQSFAKIETEKEAFAFIANPLDYFDRCMVAATNVKPIGSTPLNPESVAQMFGVNRGGFIEACKGKVPGGISNDFRPIFLAQGNRDLLDYVDGKFKINENALNDRMEKYRVYAVTDLQHEVVNYWESLAETLNNHIKRGFISRMDIYKTARMLGLMSNNNKFEVDYSDLANAIKKMA